MTAHGTGLSPGVFMYFITQVLDKLEDRSKFIAITDDILIHSKFDNHMDCIERLFQVFIKHGLRISPKKAQLFKKNVIYMGLEISYEKGCPTITMAGVNAPPIILSKVFKKSQKGTDYWFQNR